MNATQQHPSTQPAAAQALVRAKDLASTAVVLTWVLGIWLIVRALVEVVLAFGKSPALPRWLTDLLARFDLIDIQNVVEKFSDALLKSVAKLTYAIRIRG